MKTTFLKSIQFFFFFCFSLFYSQIKISGKVEFRNKGIKDVNVTLKNTYDGATTDEKGNFSFETSEKGEHILVFTHPKYVEVEEKISINNQNIEKNTIL